MEYERHPLGAKLPDMTTEEKRSFLDDIREHGVREPGWLHEGKVLIGWHRYQAARKAGVDMKWRTYDLDDPVGFVISNELRRRHLRPGEAARVEVDLRAWRGPGRPPKETSDDGPKPMSSAEMAKEAGVSERTIRRARREALVERGEAVPLPKKRTLPKSELTGRLAAGILRQENAGLKRELEGVRDAFESLEKKVSEGGGERAEWVRDLGSMREENSMLKARLAESRQRVAELEGQLKVCRRALARIREQMEAARNG